MKLILAALFLLFASVSFAQSLPESDVDNLDSIMCPKGYASMGKPYLPFTLTTDGKAIDNHSLRGKVVLINFWFESCQPCMAEMEALNELCNQLRNNKDFYFISLTREDAATIKRVKEKYALDFSVYSATDKECKRLNYACGYPTSIILDKQGTVKYRHVGGPNKKEEAREFIMSTLLTEVRSLL